MNIDWQSVFYMVATVAAIFNIILVIGLVIGGWILYRQILTKITVLEMTIKQKFNLANLSLQTAKASLPFLATKAINELLTKFLRRK